MKMAVERAEKIIDNFVDRVRDFASVHDLFVNGGKYIVALSGGADSVSLLRVMKFLAEDLQLDVEAAHCNFHLRGEESMRDESFCKDLCSKLGVKLHLVHFDTKEYSELHHVSIEMAARELRYRYFENLRRDIEAEAICVAHHRDDSVETVLLNLVRGTGIRGLRGIQPRNGMIVRPLLCVSRQDVLDYLAAVNQDYVTDSTNLVNDVKRNKVRLDLLPMLCKLNPNVSKAIFDTSLNMNEAFKVYDSAIVKSVAEVCEHGKDSIEMPISILLEKLKKQPSPESTLFQILNPRGFSSAQIESILRNLNPVPVGKVLSTSTHELLYDRGRLVVQPINYGVSDRRMLIPESGVYVYDEDKKFRVTEINIDAVFTVSRDKFIISVDALKVRFPLTVRPLKNGERFVPFGMRTSKLVSDYLTDRKLTLFEKRRQIVVVDADDTVVWIVGERTDNRVCITSESNRALIVELIKS